MAKARTNEHPFEIQTSAEQYLRTEYLSPERLSSIGYQFRLTVETGGRSFLNIGSAHGLLELLLRQAGFRAIGLDLDPGVSSDVVGTLPRLPMKDACIDVAMAFQVLEHLPFEMFKECLLELRRVARKAILISLPDQTPFWPSTQTSSRMESIAIEFHHWTWKRQTWRFSMKHPLDPEHFWEIGHSNITYETINQLAVDAGLEPNRQLRNPCFSYHTFFVFDR